MLREAIESVLAQTYQDWELIVIDDGSTDDTRDVVASLQERDSRIRYVHQDNQGLPKTRARSLELSTGPYLAFLDDDDTFLPEKLERQVAFLERRQEVGLVYGSVDIVTSAGQRIETRPKDPSVTFQQLLARNTIQVAAVLIRRRCVERVGGFRSDLASSDDYELWLRMSRSFPMAFLKETVARYRSHDANMSRDLKRRYQSHMAIYRGLLRNGLSAMERRIVLRRCGVLSYARANHDRIAGNYRTAARHYASALKYDPTVGLHVRWSRFPHPVYRMSRAYGALLLCGWRSLWMDGGRASWAALGEQSGTAAQPRTDDGMIQAYRQRWIEGVSLDPQKALAANFVDELEAYSGLPRAEVERLFHNGTEEFAREWREQYQQRSDARTAFYDESFTQIFFVMHNSGLRADLSSPYLYLYAADFARRIGARRYLDYGAGTGSGATFFARQGMDTTLADISTRMLDFAKWRFQRRGLKATYVDIKQRSLPKSAFDLITCFHVLQHLEDPVAKIRELREALVKGGILIVNGGLKKDPERPMQPDHGGVKTARKFRSVGLQKLWKESDEMRQLSNTAPRAYRRVERSAALNAAYLAFDTMVTAPRLRRALWVATRPMHRLAGLGR